MVGILDNAFQSLSRDSVCLDGRLGMSPAVMVKVSIPESGFCLFGLTP